MPLPGHWEGDLVGGTKNGHLATPVERRSRFAPPVKMPSKDTCSVMATLSRQVLKLLASSRRSLTRDSALEMAKHETFTVATNVKVWQRGMSENANGLLRRQFPKRMDSSGHTLLGVDKFPALLTSGFETLDSL
jgi:IS30 family transposase